MMINRLPLYLFFILSLYGVSGHGCSVPVFRYALERWRTDVYTVVVCAHGTLEDESVALLQEHAIDHDSLSNYTVRTIDLSTPEGASYARENELLTAPWLALYYPGHGNVRGLVWEGPLNETNVGRLIHSPARTALAEKLLAGDVATWLFIESGDAAKDDRTRRIVRQSLERAAKELKIPSTGVDIDGNAIEATDFVDYVVHFDVIDIARDDSTEMTLLSTLLGSEPDLLFYDEPMVFPVFGRGRALHAIIGDGITEKTVFDACRSITAWCSCEIKAQNPGIDLLISANWSQPFGGRMVQSEPLPPLTGLAGFMPARNDSTVVTEPMITSPQPTPVVSDSTAAAVKNDSMTLSVDTISRTSSGLYRNILWLAAVGFVLIIASTVILKSKRE